MWHTVYNFEVFRPLIIDEDTSREILQKSSLKGTSRMDTNHVHFGNIEVRRVSSITTASSSVQSDSRGSIKANYSKCISDSLQ